MFLLGGLCVLEQGPSQPGSTPELCGTSMVELLGPARDCASQFSPIAVLLVMACNRVSPSKEDCEVAGGEPRASEELWNRGPQVSLQRSVLVCVWQEPGKL